MKRPIHLFITLGFTSIVIQILLMRELIVVFYGNELSLGIMLGSWLLWVGLGSLLAALIVPRADFFSHVSALAALQTLLGIVSAASIAGVRAIPLFLQRASAGEIVGYIPIVVSSFLVLAPVGLLLGFLFDLFCHIWREEHHPVASIGSVYVFEALGAAAGGIAFACLLIWALHPSETAAVLLVLNLSAAAATLFLERRLRRVALAVSAITIAVALASFFGGATQLRALSLRWLWGNLNVTHSDDSIYGNIAFVETQEQKSLYQNGLLMFSYPNRFAAEEAVHFALLEHPAPERALLIGGGMDGSLLEALRHPIAHIDYLEVDPVVLKIFRKFFPSEATQALSDPRVTVHIVDGRLFLKEAGEPYDVILVNLPDPYTALINRFYTREFFRECKGRLAASGILCFRVNSAENYISPELQQFLGCIDRTLRESFSEIKVVPGETNIFLSCNVPGMLTLESDILVDRLDERGIKEQLQFIREYYLPDRLSDERKARLESALATAESRMNTDLKPVCYYYDAVLWSKQFKDISGSVLTFFSKIGPLWFVAAIALAFAATIAVQRLFPISWGRKSVLVAVATTGFAEITIEVVTLLGFQAIYGYVYYKVAVIVTAFMLGLTSGAAFIGRFIARGAAGRRTFMFVQALVCAYPLALLGALILFARGSVTSDTRLLMLEAQLAFPALAFLAGFVGGLQFPLANSLWLEEAPGAARAAGLTYGVDLLGSCLGAMLTTTILVPVLGIPFACLFASLLNFGSLLLLLTHSRSTA